MQAVALGERESHDPAAVGHKAANLARFAATFRVPPAFCLTTTVYETLKRALELDGQAERVELAGLVAQAYGALATRIGAREPRVAVRSSALGEDSADASFAGQHETILNVSGVGAITNAVLECWRSVSSERVEAYRRERGIAEAARIAVLVQQMVDADTSAIAFGVDPVSGDDTVVVIDAAAGLGDRIASGEVTPDRYVVRKTDLAVTRQPTGGVLRDGEAERIARLVLALERHNERPVDVECALSGGELYLLQCRPVTTLAPAFPIVWRDPKDAALHWSRDDAHFGGPVTHLLADYVANAAHFGLGRRAELFDLAMRVRLEPFNGRMYGTAEPRYPSEELPARMRAGILRTRAFARGVRRKWDEEWLPHLLSEYRWVASLDAGRLPLGELAEAWDALWPRTNEIWTIHMNTVGPAYVLLEELAETYERLTGRPGNEAFKLVQGRAPTIQQLERDLHALTELARSSPRLAAALQDGSVDSLDAARAHPEGAALADAVGPFLERHGNLGHLGEGDLRALPWRDDPGLLLAEIGRRLASTSGDPEARLARLLAEGDAILEQARAALRDRPEDLATLEEVVRTAREVGPLSEEHNYWLDRQMQSNLGRFFRAVGRRLAAEGLTERADDVYYLRIAEVSDALRARRDLRALVREREAEYARWRRLRAPKTLGAPEPPQLDRTRARADLRYRTAQDEEGVIKGVPASSGVRRGPARLVRGADDFRRFRPGDVLVCRSSNVSWVPLFTIASAVVTDVGGALSHAAVVAREFGVPAVVGVGVAFETLRDGMLVEVDGDRGIVRPLSAIAGTD